MAVSKVQTISSTKRFWNIINNGLLVYGIRNRLARIGIDITPYYWVQEEVEPCKEPIVHGKYEDYTVRYLTKKGIQVIVKKVPKMLGDELIKGFNKGQLCIGLEHDKNIAAYTFVELNDFTFNYRTFKLKKNEVYLLNMWTFHEYRGKNLAPYLRYKSYQLLKEHGRDIKYSITNYFNKSSIKFKSKLNSKHLIFYLSIVLFKKVHWNFKLKDYK